MHPIDITGPRGCERSVSIQQRWCKLRVEGHASDRDAGGDRRGFEKKFGANSKVAAAAAQRLLSMSEKFEAIEAGIRKKKELRNDGRAIKKGQLQNRKRQKKQKRCPHPEQIRVVALVDNQQLSTAGDHPRSNHRVASQTKEPRRETHAPSKSQTADAGVADEACVRHEQRPACASAKPAGKRSQMEHSARTYLRERPGRVAEVPHQQQPKCSRLPQR